MPKKKKRKHRRGGSGDPAKRAGQKAIEAVLRDFPHLAEYERRGRILDAWHADNLCYFDDEAHEALTERGWTAEEPAGDSGDIWSWNPSTIEADHDTQTYYEDTSIFAREYGLAVDLAGPASGPWMGARYVTLDALLADIEVIEAFRYGDLIPDLAHAIETAEGLPAPLSVRREKGTAQ